jgi:hypothetical protein
MELPFGENFEEKIQMFPKIPLKKTRKFLWKKLQKTKTGKSLMIFRIKKDYFRKKKIIKKL